MVKFLRLAVTVLSLMACVLLVALWVRSYWRFDTANGTVVGRPVCVRIAQGNLRVDVDSLDWPSRWKWTSSVIEQYVAIDFRPLVPNIGTFYWSTYEGPQSFGIPFWAAVLFVVIFAGIPWVTAIRRFSLRTLLIGMALIALVLRILTALL